MRWVAVVLLATASCGFDWSLAEKKDAGSDHAVTGGAAGDDAATGGTSISGGAPPLDGAAGSGGAPGVCGAVECVGKPCDTPVFCDAGKASCCLDGFQTCANPPNTGVAQGYCVPNDCYDGVHVLCGSDTCPNTLCDPFSLTCCQGSTTCGDTPCCC